MIFAMVISSMIDPEERMLKFDGISEDVKPFDHLARSTDRVGIVADLRLSLLDDTKVLNNSTLTQTSVHEPLSREMTKHVAQSKIVAIEEITDSGQESEDEEFIMYAKPDTDESDEEEDATLVQRNKPTAPVLVIFRFNVRANFLTKPIGTFATSSLVYGIPKTITDIGLRFNMSQA